MGREAAGRGAGRPEVTGREGRSSRSSRPQRERPGLRSFLMAVQENRTEGNALTHPADGTSDGQLALKQLTRKKVSAPESATHWQVCDHFAMKAKTY